MVKVRWAPSPTGNPHIGNASIALYNYVFAKANGGSFVLRIEDTDRTRSTRESEEAIFASLKWLGLQFNEGPDVGGPHGPYRQSERSDIYREHTQHLLDTGNAYRCFCSPEMLKEEREQRQAQGLPLMYSGRCRGLSEGDIEKHIDKGDSFTVRLKVQRDGETRFHDHLRGEVVFKNAVVDDQVLLKSDGFPTYHLANVVDDHLMEITHVLRGEEWISSTPKHILLYQAFGWQPPKFVHMSLLRDSARRKLSKRDGTPTGILQYRDAGYLPETIRNFLALMSFSMSDEREVFSLDEMIDDFSLDRLKTSAPVFDLQKLEWLNGVYIRSLSSDVLIERLREVSPLARQLETTDIETILPLVRERMKTLIDFDPVSRFFFVDELEYDPQSLVPKKCDADTAKQMLEYAIAELKSMPNWVAEDMETWARSLAKEKGWKVGSFFMCLRVAITGSIATPPLLESMQVLGREKCIERLSKALSLVSCSG